MSMIMDQMQPQKWQRVRRFLVLGLSSTIVDVLLLTVFKAVGTTTLVANTLAFAIATVYNFAVSRRWTYAGTGHKQPGLQFGLFVITNLIGLLLNDGIVLLLETPLHTLLGGGAWRYLPAKAVATGATAV